MGYIRADKTLKITYMADQFSMKIEGLDQLISDAEKIGGDLPNLMYRAMVNSTTLVQNKAREISPASFKNRTGTLRRSIQRRVENAGRGVIFVGEDYGKFVEFGTGPHTIYPKNGRVLRFKVDGRNVFARRVNHPGSKAYPFMEPAYRESAPKVLDEYVKIADIIVKALAD